MTYFQRLEKRTPTRFWVNNATRDQAKMAIDAGATGCTQNPAYLSKILNSNDNDLMFGKMDKLLQVYESDTNVVAALQREMISEICKLFLPMYEESGGRYGYVSIQADPFNEDVDTILHNAEEMLKLTPNALIKVPATKSGLVAVRELIGMKAAVLVTEIMSMDQVMSACELYKDATRKINAPAKYILAHINGIFDDHMLDCMETGGISIDPDACSLASWVLAKKIDRYLHMHGFSEIDYMAGGARNLDHFRNWVGIQGSITLNWSGTIDKLIKEDGNVLPRFQMPEPYGVVDDLLDQLPDFKKAYIPGSLSEEEYEAFGPVVRFRNQFEEGWSAIIRITEEHRHRVL